MEMHPQYDHRTPGASENSLLAFCALAYNAQPRSPAAVHSEPIILLVLEEQNRHLRFFVDPNWRSIVKAQDSSYMESLFPDLLERAKLHPDALFKQLSCLGVGPLVTRTVGSNFADDPSLIALYSRFVEL